jgi:hypothetical protein
MSLITTIAEFKKYIGIDANTHIESLQPFIDEAEQLYLVPLLGRAFYDQLVPLYSASILEDGVALDADNTALMPYIQRCLAYYAQLHAIPHLSVTFGDLGMRQHRGEDSDGAPRWKEEKLMYNALKNGDLHADKLLEYLEANATVSKYAAWYASTANTINSGNIVYNTSVASRHISINESRRIFLQLRNKIREIETRYISKLISKAQYDDLVVQLKANTVSPAYRSLLDKLEPIICKRALHAQLQFMRLQISGTGLFVYSGTDELIKLGQLATPDDIELLKEQLEGGCEEQDAKHLFGYKDDEAELRQFILDNIETYPIIKASRVYTVQPSPGPTWESLNDCNNKHFSV